VTQVTNENGKEVSGLREGNKAGGRDVALEQTKLGSEEPIPEVMPCIFETPCIKTKRVS
jgi:hypothetical protein